MTSGITKELENGNETFGKLAYQKYNIKGAREEIAISEYVTQNPQEQKGQWTTYFGKEAPLHVEIGMGKGKFITTLAEYIVQIRK